MAEVYGQDVSPIKILTILGCGTLGSAILYGLLEDTVEKRLPNGLSKELPNGYRPLTPKDEEDVEKPTHFIACVRTKNSAARLKDELAHRFPSRVPVKISYGDNISAVNSASTVLLGCQPQDLDTCLNEQGLVQALQGKIIISILAGITVPQLESYFDPSTFRKTSTPTTIIRAMPNTSALHHASTTLLTVSPTHPPPPRALNIANTLLSAIGTVHPTPARHMDAYTALCGSTPAFFALVLNGLLDGAVALGLKRSEAEILVAETMKGVGEGVVKGGDVGKVAENVCTPGGSSIQGLLVLERGGVRGLLADALCAAAGYNGALGRKK